jgi:DNA-binding transcriptional regulator of glucitol operon
LLAGNRSADFIVSKIIAFIQTDEQQVSDAKMDTLIEFVKVYPIQIKKHKNTSTGMN